MRRLALISTISICFLTSATWTPHSAANCGQAVCAINTDWEAQGVLLDAGTRLDLRFEYIDQDQPRAGRKRVALGEIPRHHDEVRTLNRNWIATLDHSFNTQWGVSVALPYSSRSHHHIHNHHGAQLPEAWSYEEAGDVRLLGRYQPPPSEPPGSNWGLTAGVKLSTGKHDVRNKEGELAERTLQPGTGTTDWIAGAFVHRALDTADTFAQIQVQQPINDKDHYKPGARVSLDLGLRYPLTERIALLGQINLLHKSRDSGNEAEPVDSGGRFVFISPGISASASRNCRLYGFVQLPVYQRVNGVQLTADWAASAGISIRF